MRLKYLTLCVLGLSLSACTQHMIKPTPASEQPLGQRAVSGINAIFETASYDIHGQFSIQTPQKEKTAHSSPSAVLPLELNPELKKQVDQIIKAQKIRLRSSEKKQLYEAIAKEQGTDAIFLGGRDRESAGAGVTKSVMNILNDLQFSYDGSVHYRQKMAALNLNLKYQKPTLLVQAQLPMIIDLNDFKLYSNYFAFMPFMVNRDSQASYAYVDFSKYKNDFNQINIKNLADYWKQLNALPYALARPNQVTAVALTEQEQQQGLSSKIRYQGTLESLTLQMSLFEWVNAPYYRLHVKGQKKDAQDPAIAQAKDLAIAADEAVDRAEEDAAQENQLETAAYLSAERVGELVQAKAHEMRDHDDADLLEARVETADEAPSGEVGELTKDAAEDAAAVCTAADACDAYQGASAVNTQRSNRQDDVSALSEDACEALVHAQKVPAGYFTLCREWYGLDVFKPVSEQNADPAAASDLPARTALEQLKPVFMAYQSEQLTDVQQFQQLWHKHNADIQQALKEEQADPTALIMDIGLDQAGRLQTFDYDVVKKDQTFGQFRIISTNQISNYGQAKPIDRNLLKNAKSIEEVSKGSLLERVSKGFLGSLGADQDAATAKKAQSKSTAAYLNQIALDTYQRTHSWVKTYQTVFGLYAAIKQSDLSQHYSAAEMNEIAEVSAYHFNADLPRPQGAALTRLNQLAEKHQLKNADSFDEMGYSVHKIVAEATQEYQAQQTWNKRIKQYKTKPAVFAAVYAAAFEQEYSLSDEQQQMLPKASQVFAQAFADDLKGKLTAQSIQHLQPDFADLFDEEVYRAVYADVVTHFSK